MAPADTVVAGSLMRIQTLPAARITLGSAAGKGAATSPPEKIAVDDLAAPSVAVGATVLSPHLGHL